MTGFDVRTANLRAINSMTKYPSIPTYHALDPRNGGLLDEVQPFTGRVLLTEKVDGTNSRIVLLPDGTYLVGSREELLYARGDLIGNPALGIVDAVRDLAERLVPGQGDTVTVFYGEVYGGRVTGTSKHYTESRSVGYRLFDVATVTGLDQMQSWPTERISAWRDGGGQSFASEDELLRLAATYRLDLVPRLAALDAADLPTGIEDTHRFLGDRLPRTLVALDGEPGRAEGLVLRTQDRSVIAKARFQDYERTSKRRAARR